MASKLAIDLWRAVQADDVVAVAALLSEGADPNEPVASEEYVALLEEDEVRRGAPPLRESSPWAYEAARREAAKVGPGRGYYPLLATDSPVITRLLLEADARVDVRDPATGAMVLHNLVMPHHEASAAEEIVAMALMAGAEVDAVNDFGATPLFIACWNKSYGSVIRNLLDRGADPRVRSGSGDTPLHAAGFWDDGYTPWSLDRFRMQEAEVPEEFREPAGRYWGAAEAVAALVTAGARPNAANPNNGNTPMHNASARSGPPYLPFLEALLECGGKLDAANFEWVRPADFLVSDEASERFARRIAPLVNPPPRGLTDSW